MGDGPYCVIATVNGDRLEFDCADFEELKTRLIELVEERR